MYALCYQGRVFKKERMDETCWSFYVFFFMMKQVRNVLDLWLLFIWYVMYRFFFFEHEFDVDAILRSQFASKDIAKLKSFWYQLQNINTSWYCAKTKIQLNKPNNTFCLKTTFNTSFFFVNTTLHLLKYLTISKISPTLLVWKTI